ncbi:NADP-dependent oxidoreductase [Actinoplanes solisilvae]|uniref:NADP-dependent oxidoreductase n=1 Tax=Actinoplanes solisilvae TaxID=2486853 RepID=UPI000FDA715F|nr:NADP-dependent oxidoreductase [Actinoplanes solisilvae]
MKAVRFHDYGDSKVLRYEEVPTPVPGPGEVLVKIAGSAFNPVDDGIRGGYLQQVFPVDLPHVPGIELSGTVALSAAGWPAGEPVIALLSMTAPGSAAEYALVPAEALVRAPRTVDLADAAALPSSALTAWQVLFEHAKLQKGQTVLINGAGGAVGGYAVQLAKQVGAVVTATASKRSADRLRARGADHLIDYTAEPLSGQFDVVVNLVATEAPGFNTAGPNINVFLRPDPARLADLVARVDAGELVIDVAERRPLKDLAAVHDNPAGGGKSVLLP